MTIEEIEKRIRNRKKKVCRKCGEEKWVGLFFIKRDKDPTRLRFNTPCKACFKNYAQDPARKAYLRNFLIVRTFGVNQDEYLKMLEAQGGVCKICGDPPTKHKRSLAIDHCHVTGNIRGVLCSKCNTGLGFFEDNIDRLKEAIKYLENFT